MCASSPGARECETLQSVSSRREDAGRNRRYADGIGAIKLEAAAGFEPFLPRRSEDATRFRRLSYWFKQPITLPAVANGDPRDVNPVQTQLGRDAGR